MKLAFDTNVLVYAEGLDGAEKQAAVVRIVAALPKDQKLLPVNVMGELYNVLVRKGGLAPAAARAAVQSWWRTSQVGETTERAMGAAIDLAVEHRLAIWDALVLAVADEAGCRLLLSEDMQDGFTWRGVTVVDPFSPTPSPLLAAALSS